jgi:hypothetical protein
MPNSQEARLISHENPAGAFFLCIMYRAEAHYCHRITLGELLLYRERGGREQIGRVCKWRNGNPIPKWQQFDLGDEEESGRKKYRLTSAAAQHAGGETLNCGGLLKNSLYITRADRNR